MANRKFSLSKPRAQSTRTPSVAAAADTTNSKLRLAPQLNEQMAQLWRARAVVMVVMGAVDKTDADAAMALDTAQQLMSDVAHALEDLRDFVKDAAVPA